jgi:SAM-dependent methyltransferase
MPKTMSSRMYPEVEFGGFSRVDGSIAFLVRAHAVAPEKGLVLDVGCGRGEGIEDESAFRARLCDFRAAGRKVIGIDVDEAAVGNPLMDEVRLMEPGKPWPVESESIDLAISRSVIEHVVEIERFFSELARVLRPGGIFAAHTTNKLSYPGLASSLIPNRWHIKALALMQPNRKDRDVFPTVYQCNTVWKLRGALKSVGLQGVVFGIEAEPSYLQFSQLSYALGAVLHPLIPSVFSSRLVIFARKHDR